VDRLVSENLQGAWTPDHLKWRDLTPIQHAVMIDALESKPVPLVLVGYVPLVTAAFEASHAWLLGADDSAFWNSKWKYVPELSAVAGSLLALGLIDVYLGNDPLPRAQARLVLADSRNWWRFDPEDEVDPADTRQYPVDENPSAFPEYWIYATEAGRRLGE